MKWLRKLLGFTEKSNVKVFIVLQVLNVIFSLNSVFLKSASVSWKLNGLFAFKTLMLLGISVGILAVYAVIWQMVLMHVKLVVAYLSKGLVIFWGLLWSVLFYNEQITWINILGVSLIFLGTLMVNEYE
ncbi:MAG: hypothetical protein HFH70_04450 [Lachnospiraceae bacterium]|nr:hypothetical protein [Lachnospiraceae bacterium]